MVNLGPLGPLPQAPDSRDEDAWLALYCAILSGSH